MSNDEIFRECIIDVKQFFKKHIFNSKKERVNHPFKPYNRSGKSPYPFDKIVGNIAKEACGNENFFENYRKFNHVRNTIDIIKKLKKLT